MSSQERTRRTFACLVLYVLFAFIPGLHAALHPWGVDGPATPAGTVLAGISAACPDGCENPEHRHLSPTHECPVCKTGFSPNAVPQSSDSGLHEGFVSRALARTTSLGLGAPDICIEHARGPPQSRLS